ncbi:hypothetical protein C7974DRAFT_425297 [Boeremia exigua]|uniref:uncharacterized protein n=1 Tax=Boeremia exigua TaxID=749465 RepID=UPI001E8DD76F|nr:uncharacterized protein C7974DRAFT_425297 [Boeremia exigua]KAH6625669.1 hypothetical protein C7974DRAFT_425297 [Boeremia exigua]
MAGYGNRTAPDYTADALADEHSSTRLGLTDSHSPPTYGAGFGNKRASQPTTHTATDTDADTTAAASAAADTPRFNTQDAHGSAPYSNAHTYGSASTAGAGWGNKTGSFSEEGRGEGGHDSALGKAMQKIGGALHAPGLARKGEAKREAADAHGEVPTAN